MKKLRVISSAINFPRSCTRDFWVFREKKKLKKLKAVRDHAIRWNSSFHMLERAVYLKEAIKPFVLSRDELIQHSLTNREWALAEFLLLFLEPFNHATNQLQSTSRPNLQMTFVMYEKLFNNLENIIDIFDDMRTVPDWFNEVKRAIHHMWEKLKLHYSRTATPYAYVDANILHPGKKLSLFRKKRSSFAPEDAERYSNEARLRFLSTYNTPDTIVPQKCKHPHEDSESESESEQEDLYNQFDHYLRMKRD